MNQRKPYIYIFFLIEGSVNFFTFHVAPNPQKKQNFEESEKADDSRLCTARKNYIISKKEAALGCTSLFNYFLV